MDYFADIAPEEFDRQIAELEGDLAWLKAIAAYVWSIFNR